MKVFLCVILSLFCLCSCSFYDVLGIDTHDYAAEKSIKVLASDGEIALQILEIIPMMVQNSPYLSEFSTPAEAAELYRDGILCTVLDNNFSKYNGNADLIDQISEKYPEYELTTVIPALDFESTVYRYFGGTASVQNSSTKIFTYLEKVDSYASLGISVDNSADIAIKELYETENTYVCVFNCTMNGVTSPEYRILCMKREDGTFYIKSLTEIKNEP
ncbi:MAG: hypothetical protein IJC81_04130 [Clostridia bacterium]|nr:hypothetical protein [Clostridia bacterium]